MNPTVIGIDLGTTNSCAALFKHTSLNDSLMVVPTDSDIKTIPSYVYYNGDKNEIVVGSAAKNSQKTHYESTVYDSKRMIGKKFSELNSNDIKNWPFKVNNDGLDHVVMKILSNKVMTDIHPEDVSSEILKRIKFFADRFCGNEQNNKTSAVITVPAYFKNSQRKKTIEAAERANLKVIRTINEPTAAAVAYCYENKETNDFCKSRLLIYDFGGGTFDISVIDIETTNLPVTKNSDKSDVDITITVKATGGDNHLGGQDIDNVIVKKYIDKYKKACGTDLYEDNMVNIKKRISLKKAVESAKIILSNAEEATVDCDFLEDKGINITLTRSEFENSCIDLFKRTITIIEKILKDAEIEKSSLTGVVLVGGSSKIPKVVNLIEESLPGVKIYKNLNADEVIAQGAAIIASNQLFNKIIVKDVISHNLSTDQNIDDIVVMIPRYSNLPCKETKTFATYADNQEVMDINIFEGEEKKTSGNTLLKCFRIDGIPPKKKGEIKVQITFDIDLNGVLKVTAKAIGLDICKTLTVE